MSADKVRIIVKNENGEALEEGEADVTSEEVWYGKHYWYDLRGWSLSNGDTLELAERRRGW